MTPLFPTRAPVPRTAPQSNGGVANTLHHGSVTECPALSSSRGREQHRGGVLPRRPGVPTSLLGPCCVAPSRPPRRGGGRPAPGGAPRSTDPDADAALSRAEPRQRRSVATPISGAGKPQRRTALPVGWQVASDILPPLGRMRNGLGISRPAEKGGAIPAAACAPDAAPTQAAIPPQPSRPVTGAGNSGAADAPWPDSRCAKRAASKSPDRAASLLNFPAVLVAAGAFFAGSAHAASFAPVADSFEPCVDMAPGEARDAWAQWWSGLDCLPPVLAEAPTEAPAQPRTQWERLIDTHGSGEAVRLLVQPQERPLVVAPAIPLPASVLLLLSALAGLLTLKRCRT